MVKDRRKPERSRASEAARDRDLLGAAENAGRPSVCVDSAELLGEAREIGILHRGELYRLRMTSQGKLILTK